LDFVSPRSNHCHMAFSIASPPRLALVGDRSSAVRAHAKVPDLMDALAIGAGEPIELYWLHSKTITDPRELVGFDGVWVVPGGPYEHRDGVLAAIEAARTQYIPLLGTCGGFQHLLIEFARNVCGLGAVENAEEHPAAPELLIVPLACALFGEEATVVVEAGTLAARAMGAGRSTERFFCRYGLNDRYLATLEEHGLVVSGWDETGEARIAELPGHPFFLGSLFQPELSSDPTFVHPLIAAFAAAVRQHSQRAEEARPAGGRAGADRTTGASR
jgi:CTP synthase (UTP-ammonia lyase)